MKLFCSYAYTGEDVDAVHERMRLVVETLIEDGHQAYCPLFDPVNNELYEKGDMSGVFQNAFSHLTAQDAVVVILSSRKKSEGQLLEIGAALSHQIPVILLCHTSIKEEDSYLPLLAKKAVSWSTPEDLRKQLRHLS